MSADPVTEFKRQLERLIAAEGGPAPARPVKAKVVQGKAGAYRKFPPVRGHQAHPSIAGFKKPRRKWDASYQPH